MKDKLQKACDKLGIPNLQKKYCTKHQSFHSRKSKGYPSCKWEDRFICPYCKEPFKKVDEYTYKSECEHFKDLRLSIG